MLTNTFGMALSLLAAAPALAEGAESLKSLPANKWVRLAGKSDSEDGYCYSQMVYAPSRGQILHWGALACHDRPGRNDVRAFDAAARMWVSDYPSDPKVGGAIVGGGAGSALSYTGQGKMLPSGNPYPACVVNGVCWDSKRGKLVYTMAGLMAAYDPIAKTWADLKAKDIPSVYGIGTGYDPINDEIVLFPHFGGRNDDMASATGTIPRHSGTFRYSFQENAWRSVRDTFGSEETKKARKAVAELMASVSKAADGAYVLRQRKGVVSPEDVRKGFADAPVAAGKLALPAAAKESLDRATARLKEASEAATAGKWQEAMAAGGRALWIMNEDILAGPLRVEPPPRCATPLLYLPKKKALLMFGGHDSICRTDLDAGSTQPQPRNDTWLYECEPRQWRPGRGKAAPPGQNQPRLVYDPASGKVLLVIRAGQYDRKPAVSLWAFDQDSEEWSQLDEQPWTEKDFGWHTVGLDEKGGVLLMTSVANGTQRTYAMRPDLAALTPKPAWPLVEPPPIKPLEVPTEDPAWVAKLKELPANKWVHPRPPREPVARDWGNLGCDRLRGWVVYSGGGHSTYQVNNAEVYNVGANRWATSIGSHNDFVPPVGWEGAQGCFRGGPRTGHWRNQYDAADGRMYLMDGSACGALGCYFYDLDRGGVWRHEHDRVVGEAMPNARWGSVMAGPDGKVIALGKIKPNYYGWQVSDFFFASYDAYTRQRTVVKVSGEHPHEWWECRPFCYLPDRQQVFLYEFNGEARRQITWLYDIKANKFTDLKPTRQPKTSADGKWSYGVVCEYFEGQDAVFSVIGLGWGEAEQWVYSFKRNTWAPLPLESDAKVNFQRPYGQTVYVAKYGVLVNVPHGGTALMRPDLSQMKWE